MSAEFAAASIKKSIALFLDSNHFKQVDRSALDLLADVIIGKILEIARESQRGAEICKSLLPSPANVITAVMNCSSPQVVSDILDNVGKDSTWSYCVKDFPPFQYHRERAVVGILSQRQDERVSASQRDLTRGSERSQGRNEIEHVPTYFPPIPDDYTFKATPSLASRRTRDPLESRKRLLEERKEVSRTMSSINESKRYNWGDLEEKQSTNQVNIPPVTIPGYPVMQNPSSVPTSIEDKYDPVARENDERIG